ncbi:MAG: trypsin-like peptidase domain-containing protein, partial [Nocardioides sp.]|nr:trypsin-like peptidase domain-containing protein [Nocardioides sp.]
MATTRQRVRTGLGLAAGLGLVAGAVGGLVTGHFAGHSAVRTAPASCDTKHVAQVTMPSLVTVHLESGGVGSGAFVRRGGYVVTNSHVVASAPAGRGISVLLSSGESLPAQLVGRDASIDLAVLKVRSNAPLIDVGDSARLSLGQRVVAIGSPLGLSGTVTAGIVSALGRRVPVPADNGGTAELTDVIQTDASINPGNSGGALVDCRGRLVGINTAIATVPGASGQVSTGSVGIGFAVPVDLAMPVVDSLIRHGSPGRAVDIGISVSPIPPAAASSFGVEVGLYVGQVTPSGLAERAGLRAGDVIVEVN